MRLPRLSGRSLGDGMKTTLQTAVIMFLLVGTATGGQFDHAAYGETTLDEIFAAAPKISEGADLFFKKRQFEVELLRGPQKVSNGWITVVFRTLGISDPPPVNHEILVRSPQGKEVEMYVQDVLVEPLREEVAVGSKVRVFALYLFFNGHTQKPGFVLNEFQALDTSPNSAAAPDADR